MILALFITIVICFTALSAIIDVEHLKKRQYVLDHNSRWFQRLTFILIIAVFDWKLAIVAGLIFTVLFDHVLNIFWKKHLFYIGGTSKFDLFWRDNPSFYKAVKLVLLVTAILILGYAPISI